MPGMRVHELAKMFDISSKEMLERLAEIGISAKSHASNLSEADVEKAKESLAPEIKQRAGELEEEEAKLLAEEQAAEAEAKAAEEAERRAAVEAEREAREAERARREAERGEVAEAEDEGEEEDIFDEFEEEPAAPVAPSLYGALETQIEAERSRVEREKAEAAERARIEAMARDVAKKQAVAEALANRGRTKAPKAATPEEPKAAPKAAPATPAADFSSLLSQIQNEQERLEQVKTTTQGRKAERRGKKGRAEYEPSVPELEGQPAGEDRYAQMAVQAEKLQRDKVLAEARAAVEAASNEGQGRRKKRKEKREAEARERAEQQALERGLDPELVLDDSVIEVPQGSTVGQLAELLNVSPNDIIKRLFLLGSALTVTQTMSDELIELIADDLGRKVRVVSPEEEYAVVYHDSEDELQPRPPVVTVMGHVDHGKTSLLDAIRQTGVAEHEAGGITQQIGASVSFIDGRQITFIDTPGHEAFTAMRARGAEITDVVVLVVAADDGVMPQTIEAINHAKAAGVPIVVAVNKIDKPGSDPNRVRQELTEYEIIPEEWGGQTMFVDVSAKQNLHIDDLLETILLQADVLELKANPDALASGFVVEAKLDKGRGSVATILVNRGTLRPGDVVVAGTAYGKVRALISPRGEQVDAARPADPVEVLGLNSVPSAGDEFRVFEDERDARRLAEERSLRQRLKEQEQRSHMSLDDLFSRIGDGTVDLNLVVKADTIGSIEALRDAFEKMDQSEVKINIIHAAVGGVTETDVTLAAASDAIIIGFNVRPMGKAREMAEREQVDIRLYRVIYQALEDINAARVGLLSPDIVEQDTGSAEVRETFKVPKMGVIAGCYVTNGEISRNDQVRIVRDGTVVFEGTIGSMRRFKDDVTSVKSGYECGIGIEGYQDLKIGDVIEGYQVVEVERTE